MRIDSAANLHAQEQKLSSITQKSSQASSAQVSGSQNSSSNTSGQVALSGRAIMLSRLFGDTNIEPPVQTQLSRDTMTLAPVHFLTSADRDMLSDLYAQSRQQGVDLRYVDDLARDLGQFRKFGSVSANLNNGKMYDEAGHTQTFLFTDTDKTIADRILSGMNNKKTVLDNNFLRYELDPGFSFNHHASFDFLEDVVNNFMPSSSEENQPLNSKFFIYQAPEKNNFIIETSSEVKKITEEPDFRSINGVFSVTETGRQHGFQLINGMPVDIRTMISKNPFLLALLGLDATQEER